MLSFLISTAAASPGEKGITHECLERSKPIRNSNGANEVDAPQFEIVAISLTSFNLKSMEIEKSKIEFQIAIQTRRYLNYLQTEFIRMCAQHGRQETVKIEKCMD